MLYCLIKKEEHALMQWLQILAVLACPLMMLFCMKGMFGGKGHHSHKNSGQSHWASTSEEVKALQIKMAELIEQNNKLTKEIQALKNVAPAEEVEDEQRVNYNRVVS